MWQIILVYFIVANALGFVLFNGFKLFRSSKSESIERCQGCLGHCVNHDLRKKDGEELLKTERVIN